VKSAIPRPPPPSPPPHTCACAHSDTSPCASGQWCCILCCAADAAVVLAHTHTPCHRPWRPWRAATTGPQRSGVTQFPWREGHVFPRTLCVSRLVRVRCSGRTNPLHERLLVYYCETVHPTSLPGGCAVRTCHQLGACSQHAAAVRVAYITPRQRVSLLTKPGPLQVPCLRALGTTSNISYHIVPGWLGVADPIYKKMQKPTLATRQQTWRCMLMLL